MTIYIGQASCDERGKYVGGQAGNQTGTELNIRTAYTKNWHTLIRFKDASRALKCAAAMSQAVANMNIGYDQGERNTILPLARAANWDLSKITKPCECDCSSLVGVCGIAAGIPESTLYQGGNLCYTGNEADRFRASGMVDTYTSSDYVSSMSKWQVGDILVSSSHTVIVVSGSTPSGGNTTIVSNDIDELARAVIAGRYGTGSERKAALGNKYEAVQKRVNELLGGSSSVTTPTSGIVPGTYKVICGELNVRSAPKMDNSTLVYQNGKKVVYTRGDIINGIASDTTTADGYVWAHYVAYSGATRYVAIGTQNGSEKYLAKA